jgi:hypothetical protein
MTLRERLNDVFSKAPPMYRQDRYADVRALSPGQRRPLIGGLLGEITPEYNRWREETLKPIMIAPPIDHPGIEEEDPLCRFMDLPKFLDLIVGGRLLLPRLTELKDCDPHECEAPPDYSGLTRSELESQVITLKEFAPESMRDAGSYLNWLRDPFGPASESFDDLVRKMPLEDLKQAAWYLEHSRLKRDLVCGCWYGDEMESDAMWRLYCEHVGVAIITTVSRLKAAVRCVVPRVLSEHFRLSLARVAYEDTRGIAPWLVKRPAFKHEHEVRLYVDYPLVRAPGFELLIKPHRLIKEVIVTPYAKEWQSKIIEETVERLLEAPGGRHVRRVRIDRTLIRQSTHLDASDPRWPGWEPPRHASFSKQPAS